MSDTKHPDVTAKLSDCDANAFAIIGKVAGALRRAGYVESASTWCEDALKCASYDDLLRLAMNTVEIE